MSFFTGWFLKLWSKSTCVGPHQGTGKASSQKYQGTVYISQVKCRVWWVMMAWFWALTHTHTYYTLFLYTSFCHLRPQIAKARRGGRRGKVTAVITDNNVFWLNTDEFFFSALLCTFVWCFVALLKTIWLSIIIFYWVLNFSFILPCQFMHFFDTGVIAVLLSGGQGCWCCTRKSCKYQVRI